MQRPSYLSSASSSTTIPRRQPSFTHTKGSSTFVPAWGPPSAAVSDTPPPKKKTNGPSLSLSGLSGVLGEGEDEIHPLKYTWEVYFSQRGAGNGGRDKRGANKDKSLIEDGGEGAGKKDVKESREEWEGQVTKLGGFSSIESLHPFLLHLTPPSLLPSSLSSTSTLFPASASPTPPSQNLICDLNIFRSPIQPMWEDPSNTGGGRWVIRLRKGVADRVWEEVVWALVGERIGTGEEGEGKVNGVVLSCRRDEDILSVWCATASRSEKDAIRESIRASLSPLLSASSLSALQIDYKPHPLSSHHAHPRHHSHSHNSNHSNQNSNNSGEEPRRRERERENSARNNGGGNHNIGGAERGVGGRGFGGYRTVSGGTGDPEEDEQLDRRERRNGREREKSGTIGGVGGPIVWGRAV